MIETSSNLNVSIISRENGFIVLSVAGTNPSEVKGDEWIRATVSGCQSTQNFSVVIPGGIGTPHPQPDSNVPCKWRFLDSTTSPASTHPTPSIPVPTPGQVWKYGCAAFCHVLPIQVNDQFGDPIGNLFENSVVEEYSDGKWWNINQKVNSNGIYLDYVGPCVEAEFIPVPSQYTTYFLNQALIMIPFYVPETTVQKIDVRIDYEYPLLPHFSIIRTIHCLRGQNRVRVVWPD